LLLALSAALIAVTTATTFADDGARLFRQISSPPGQVGSPEPEGEHAFIDFMNFYVPAQMASGELTTINYCTADEGVNCETAAITSEFAKPLVTFFVYGPVITFDDPSTSGFPGHGRRDAYAAVSLDDGETWKRTNLSNSGDKSSFVTETYIQDPAVPAPEFEVTADSPFVTSATWINSRTQLTVFGGGATPASIVDIRNAVTKDLLGTARARANGTFTWVTTLDPLAVPCSVQSGYSADNIWGPWLEVAGAPADCIGDTEVTLVNDYPGDVTNGIFSVAGNRVFAAWQSKFCQGGFPAWSSEYDVDTVATYLGIDTAVDLYLTDLFVVGGPQLSVDYREQEEFPGEYDDIGEVPYNCLWTARGVLREDPDALGTTELQWFQAERLTSGRRDVNRIETACIIGAGCAVTWQEDPDGLRPGEGEGAGTGWAGATTASQTDVWYSFVRWEDFDIVDNNGTFEPLGDLSDTTLGTNRPQPAIPLMVAARLTNNARCNIPVTGLEETYCNNNIASAYLIPNQCIGQVSIPLGPQGELTPVCVADTNRDGVGDLGDTPNVANTASSRPRLNLQARDSDGDGVTDDAWIISFSEEDKGLGRFGFLTTEEWTAGDLNDLGVPCGDPDVSKTDDCFEADIGKNIKWHTFAMGTPKTSLALSNGEVDASTVDFSLVNNLVVQGDQLNQPEVNWRTGTMYPPMSTADMWDFGETYNYLIFNSEIARRSSLLTQGVAKALNSESGIIALPLYKQGTVRQGGPADIMARRFVIDTEVQPVECPLDENVDADQPIITSATYEVGPSERAWVHIVGTGADAIDETLVQVRNVVTLDLYGLARPHDEGADTFDFYLPVATWGIPCAVQAADADGTLEFGPWIAVANVPEDMECDGPIPPECEGAGIAPQAVADNAFTSQATENPYDVSQMKCEYTDDSGNIVAGVVLFTDGENPLYPHGLCMAPAINLSARTPFLCGTGGSSLADGVCPGLAMECEEVPGYGQLCSADDPVVSLDSLENPENIQVFDKLLSYYECPGWDGEDVSNGGNTGTSTIPGACGTEDASVILGSNLNDQSWYMPLEISKAHRGFLDGDFVMAMYAWSPNYKDNTTGHDRYELYARRSFDGGVTWTTLPTDFLAANGETYSGDGTTTCETWRDGDTSLTDSHICTEYAAGDPEQSRNVSQLKSMQFTILDPRYTPYFTANRSSMPDTAPDWADDWLLFTPVDPTDIAEPSRYFLVAEDGDNTTTAVGEAEPLDLVYGRAELFGDVYTVWTEIDTGFSTIDDCYPNNTYGDTSVSWAEGTGFCNEFDGLEEKKEDRSEEASIVMSPYGDFLYATWGQYTVDENDEFVEGDAVFRRVWYLDDYIPLCDGCAYDVVGQGAQ
jgi:hypothetical protein